MKEFVFRMPTRVIFAAGAVTRIGAECKNLGGSRALLVTGRNFTVRSSYFGQIVQSLQNAGLFVQVYAEIEADPSVETIDCGAKLARDCGIDVVVAFGGGSPIDAAKSIAMLCRNDGSILEYVRGSRLIEEPALPLICIPSTAGSGSEVTAAAVATDRAKQEKIGLSHDYLLPRLAIVDPLIHSGMPPTVTAYTGIDALTHAIEAYVATKAQPITDALCLQAIRLIGDNLRRAVARGDDLDARGNMAVASLLAGAGFTNAGLGAVHGLAHPVGARFDVAHGLANGILLPYVMEHVLIGELAKFREIAIALGEDVSGCTLRQAADRAVQAVIGLNRDIGIPVTLREVGVTEDDVEDIVADAAGYRMLPNSPRLLQKADLTVIVRRALGKPQ